MCPTQLRLLCVFLETRNIHTLDQGNNRETGFCLVASGWGSLALEEKASCLWKVVVKGASAVPTHTRRTCGPEEPRLSVAASPWQSWARMA